MDGPRPERYTDSELSRIHDVLRILKPMRLHRTVFKALPHSLKLEYNWSDWKYMPSRGDVI
jgi:hypothetical protein